MPDRPSRAAQLRDVAAMLDAESYLLDYGTSLSLDLDGGTPAAHIHGCLPHTLRAAHLAWPTAEAHEDSDGILRWVETTLHGIEVTLYRR